VAGHPLIGYRRGRYSKAELHSLDAYAARLGITMFPCIQTLGHLEQVLKHGRYRNLGDNDSVLSVKSADARRLVETLIREASEPYASRLIHVGMDEPWGIGRGRTFEYGKAIDPRALYLDHVSFVAETCEHLGLEPLMWGDVIIGKDEAALTDAQRAAFPANMGLVFWDYYAETGDFYTARIAEYRAMGKEPLCAPGIWNWGSLWPSFRKVRQTLPLFMAEARKAGIRRVLLTAWGDDGQECPLAANWPSLALFAGESWRSGSDDEVWDGGAGGAASMAGAAGFDGDPGARVRALTGLDPELLVRLGDLDLLPGEEGRCGALGKLLLWEDPLAARYSHQLGGITLRGRYAALAGLAGRARMAAESLRSAGGADSARTAHSPRGGADPSPGDPASEPQLLLDYAEALCRVLSDKADFYNDARAAYRAGDRKAMARLSRRLGRLVRSVPRLWQARRALWFLEFRSAGWEVLDLRFGGLMARLETARGRLEAWCSGSLSCLEELEEEPIAEFDSIAIAHPAHRRIHTGSLVQ
jgi:hypothetical protein